MATVLGSPNDDRFLLLVMMKVPEPLSLPSFPDSLSMIPLSLMMYVSPSLPASDDVTISDKVIVTTMIMEKMKRWR